MRWNVPEQGPSNSNDQDTNQERNTSVIVNAGLVVAACFFLASPLPAALVPVALKGFLFCATFGAAIMALLRGETWNAPYLSAWDQSLFFFMLSLFAGFFVDPAAVSEAVGSIEGARQ